MAETTESVDSTGRALLSTLRVQPIEFGQRPQWCELMNRHHYLGFIKTAGERIFYAAKLNGQWVALLSWTAGALHVGCREEWLGWDAQARKERLHLVANNTRFLILPGSSIKNLASKALSLNLKRLSQDWERFYGHPIWLAETFVDPERFRGVCYRAAGWKEIGKTAGFTRLPVQRGFYEANGKPKLYFAYPLIDRIRERIASPFFTKGNKEVFAMDVSRLPIEGHGGLIETLKTIRDPRQKRGMRHSCVSVMAVSTCAMLSGARGYNAIAQWAKELSPSQLDKLRCQKPPSVSPIKRVLQRLDPEEFDEKISRWLVQANGVSQSKGISVDGKTARGSYDGEGKPIHLLSALLHHEKIVITQKKIPDKTNEIPEFRKLLSPLDLKGMLVTADSMHCQDDHSTFLVKEKGADYLWTLKENQPSLYELVNAALEDQSRETISRSTLSSKGHGRLDNYECVVKTWTHDLARQHSFPFISQICKITRTWSDLDGSNEKSEVRRLLTSAAHAEADDLLRASIDHWAIENSSHYVRDETFGEDRSRIRKGNGPQIMATLRNLSIGMIRLSGASNIAEGVRHFQWGRKGRVLRAIGVK